MTTAAAKSSPFVRSYDCPAAHAVRHHITTLVYSFEFGAITLYYAWSWGRERTKHFYVCADWDGIPLLSDALVYTQNRQGGLPSFSKTIAPRILDAYASDFSLGRFYLAELLESSSTAWRWGPYPV